MNSQQEEIRLSGPINQDYDDTVLPQRHVRNAINTSRLTNAENVTGVPRNRRGNALTPYSHPPSLNFPDVVGSVEDQENATLIQAWYNDQGNHEITRLYHQRGSNGETVQLIQSGLLNFQPREFVSMWIVDGTLQWTSHDNISKKLILDWAERPANQNQRYEVYIQEDQSGVSSVAFTFVAVMGTTLVQLFNFYTQTNFPDRATVIRDLANALNTFTPPLGNTFSDFFTATACGDFLEITVNDPSQSWVIAMQTGGSPYQIHVQLVDEYAGFTRNVLDKTANPLECAPICTFENDSSRDSNFIKNRYFQFCTRVIRQSGEYSSYSQITTPIPSDGCGGGSPNCIRVNFQDQRLSTNAEIADIEFIEIWVREKNISGFGQWEIRARIPRFDYVLQQEWKFYNDTVGTIPSQDEQNYTEPAIPLRAKAGVNLPDQSTNRDVLMNTKEGYDPVCLDVGYTTTYEPARRNFATITFRVEIVAPRYSDTYTQIGQPIYGINNRFYFGGAFDNAGLFQVQTDGFHECPSGGLPFYVVGQPITAISVQNDPTGAILGTPTFIQGTTIFDANLQGNTGNPQNDTGRQAMGQAMISQAVYSTVEITVPAGGQYVIRMADPRCSFGSSTPHFDLSNVNRLYEKTSGNARFDNVNNGGVSGVFAREHEVIIDVPDIGGAYNLGTVYVVSTQGYDLQRKIYLYNNEGRANSVDDIRNGESAERQQIELWFESGIDNIPGSPGTNYIVSQTGITDLALQFPSSTKSAGSVISQMITDHNGHVMVGYDWVNTINNQAVYLAAVGITGDPSNPSGSITGYTFPNVNVNNLRVLHDLGQEYYAGQFDGVLLTFTGVFNLQNFEAFFPNLNIPAHEVIRTQVEGTVVDPNGNPVADVSVVLQDGSSGTTDALGFYSIPVYGDMNLGGVYGANNNVRTARTFFSDLNCGYSIPFAFSNINNFEAAQPYSTSVHFQNGVSTAAILSGRFPAYLARGATYLAGIVLVTRNGQKTFVANATEIVIPDATENLQDGAPVVTAEIFSPVPIPEIGERFIRAIPVVSNNLTYFDHIEWTASDIQYLDFIDVNAESPTNKYRLGSFGTQASQIAITVDFDLYNGVELNSYGQNRSRFYEFTEGDTIKFLYDENGFVFSVNLQIDIQGFEDGRNIIIKNTSGLPELKPGVRFRISEYREQESDQQVRLFERGNCIEILNPYSDNPTWSQTVFQVDAWDTHYLTRVIPGRDFYDPNNIPNPLPPIVYRINTYASPGPSDFNIQSLDNQGKVTIIAPDQGFNHYPTGIRLSEAYFPDTKVNGLGVWFGLEQTQLPIQNGAIAGGFFSGNRFLVIQQYKVFSIYPGVIPTPPQGNTPVALIERFFASNYEYQADFGTDSPESIAFKEGIGFFFDKYTGNVVRVGNNGADSVSELYFMRKFFADLAIEIQRLNQAGVDIRIRGAIHGRYNSYVLSFEQGNTGNPAPGARTTIPNSVEFPALTISFHQGNQETTGWDTQWSYKPQWMAAVGEELVTTYQGDNWIHERNTEFNTWYGQSYPSEVTTIFGRSNYHDARKIALSVHQVANLTWFIKSMNVYEAGEIVQNTNLEFPDQWRTIERDHYGDVPRNTLTPNVQFPILNGDSMRAHAFEVTFTIDTRQFAVLQKVFFKYIISQNSLR